MLVDLNNLSTKYKQGRRRLKKEEEQRRQEKQRQFEERQRKQRRFEQEEIRKQRQRRYREERRDSVAPKQESVLKLMLPKLVITKFNGTHLDWF